MSGATRRRPVAGAQTVDEIVAKNIEAKGGLDKLKGTTTVRMAGTATMQGTPVPIRPWSKRPNLMRNEMEVAGQKMVQGYRRHHDVDAGAGDASSGAPPGPQTELLKSNSQFDSVFLDWKEKGHKIDYKGKESDGGKELHHLVLTPKEGPVSTTTSTRRPVSKPRR